MSPDTTRELSTEEIDSLIEEMRQKAEKGEEDFTDEWFEDMRISDLIQTINEPNYDKFAPINGMFIRYKESQWEPANYIDTFCDSNCQQKVGILIKHGDEEESFKVHIHGNVRILEGPDYVYIQITPRNPQANQPKLELFIPKDKWEKDWDPETLAIRSRVHWFILQDRQIPVPSINSRYCIIRN